MDIARRAPSSQIACRDPIAQCVSSRSQAPTASVCTRVLTETHATCRNFYGASMWQVAPATPLITIDMACQPYVVICDMSGKRPVTFQARPTRASCTRGHLPAGLFSPPAQKARDAWAAGGRDGPTDHTKGLPFRPQTRQRRCGSIYHASTVEDQAAIWRKDVQSTCLSPATERRHEPPTRAGSSSGQTGRPSSGLFRPLFMVVKACLRGNWLSNIILNMAACLEVFCLFVAW